MIFVGAGNMATNLALAFHAKGETVELVWSRTEQSARTLAEKVGARWTTSLADIPVSADVVIYAVKDVCLAQVLSQVNAPHALHLHTAGSVGLEVFSDRQPHAGVFYPFQTLSKGRIVDFSSLPVFIEAKDKNDGQRIRDLALRITSEVYTTDSDTRRRLHLAGVFANNFTNCMYMLGMEQLERAGLPPKVLLSLIDETAAKMHFLSPLEAQTGPARRADTNVMERHKAMLPPEQKELYSLISSIIQQQCNFAK